MFYDLPNPRKSSPYDHWPQGRGSLPCQDGEGAVIDFPVIPRSALITGKTGVGKSFFTKACIEERLRNDPSVFCVFFEIKPGDFSNPFLRPGDKMIGPAPRLQDQQRFRWNLVKEIRQTRDWEEELNQLGTILFEDLLADPRNRLWAEGARQTFLAFVRTTLYRYKEPPSNAVLIRNMKDISRLDFLSYLSWHPKNRSMLRDYFEYDPSHTQNYVLPKKAMDIFFFLQDVLGRFTDDYMSEDGTDTIADFLGGQYGNRLFLAYDYAQKDSHSSFFRYFLKKIITEKLSYHSNRQQPVWMILDEICDLDGGDFGLVPGLTLGREYGLAIWLATQSIAKLHRILPANQGEYALMAALSGLPALICFQPGDGYTIETYQQLFGKKRVQTMRMPLSRLDKATASTELVPIVGDEDFASLGMGEFYAKLCSAEPVRLTYRPELKKEVS